MSLGALPAHPAWFRHERDGAAFVGAVDPTGDEARWLDLGPMDVVALLREGGLRQPDLAQRMAATPSMAAPTRWLPPVPRGGKILCLAKNYVKHAREFGAEAPKEPIFFAKLPDTLVAHGDDVVIPSWLETRVASELELYPQIVQLARGVIAEAFSSDVITPGVTTTDDVRWWLRQRFQSLGLPVWFHPICDVERRTDDRDDARAFFGDSDATIHRGDVLHCDVGIRYLRLCTDTQEMGYVLRAEERDVPAGLQRALQVGNRWQDLLTSSFVAGRTGNQILAETLRKCRDEGVRNSVYTHPLGCFGHAPGPTIGMWDNQGPTPVRGDWPLHANTCYAIEGNVKVQVPEWDDQWVQIGLEQDACFDGQKVHYLGGRQTRWHLVR